MMFDSLLKNLGEVKATAGQLLVKCPAHDDEKPSLSISIKNGKTLLHCHAGCSVEAVLAAVSMSVKDLFPREVDKPAKKKIVAAYQYRDELGELLFESVRFEPKGFSYRSPLDGGYRWSIAGVRLVPYRLPELLAADRDFPVFIVEGEKDVDNLRAIGVSATCNPMGALKWKDDYAEHLRGFDCVILPDNDDAGRRHAREVAASLLGEAAQVSILEIPGLPEKGDVSDWLATGGTCEDLFALLTGAEIVTGNGIESSAVRPDELPERFYLTETGIYHRGEKDVFVCTPLRVAAYTCDKENGNWGRLVEFPDKTGIEHSLIIPMSALSGDAAEVRRTLMDAGLMISPVARGRQLFLEFLLHSNPTEHITSVNQLGWHDGAFVLPDTVISNDSSNSTLRLQNVDRAANKFRTAGTLEDWRDRIGKYCVGNSRLIFAVSVAFAAALLPIAEEPNGGFHLHGTSSTGKTTALLVAGSVWGGGPGKGFLETWRATANGLEAVAEMHNHSLLLLDEISQVNPHEVGQVVYSLSNGFGKSRMSKSMTSRPKAEWALTFLSSGEKTLEQVMQEANQRQFGGQEARFVNVAAEAGRGCGLFEQLHGFGSGNDLSKHLAAASLRYHGEPIRHFLRAVCTRPEKVKEAIRSARQYFNAKLQYATASGEVYRVASRFALVAAGGILATEFAATGWGPNEAIECTERIFDEWLTARGTAGSYDTAQGVRQVLAFLEQHGGSRFQSINDPPATRIPNRAGFRRERFDGCTEYLILPAVFEREVCRGFQHVSVAKELERLGLLHRGSEKNYLSSKERLPELGRKRVYIVTADAEQEWVSEDKE